MTIEQLKEKHERLRDLLIANGCEEHWDCIIDSICEIVWIDSTIILKGNKRKLKKDF